jgi:hypothetical protein
MYKDEIAQIKQLSFKNKIYDEMLGNEAIPGTVDPDLLCFYGHKCKRKNPAHTEQFHHVNIPERLAAEQERYLNNFEALTTDITQKVDAAYTEATAKAWPEADAEADAPRASLPALEQAIAAADAVETNKKELFTLDKSSIRGLDFDIPKLNKFIDTPLQQLQTGDVVPFDSTGWVLEHGIKPLSKIVRAKDRQRVHGQQRRQREAERRAAEQSSPSGDRRDKGKKRGREGGRRTRRKKTRRRKSRKVLRRRLGKRKTRVAPRSPVLK